MSAPESRRLAPPSPASLRDELERLVVADLLGPAGGSDEEVDDTRVRENGPRDLRAEVAVEKEQGPAQRSAATR